MINNKTFAFLFIACVNGAVLRGTTSIDCSSICSGTPSNSYGCNPSFNTASYCGSLNSCAYDSGKSGWTPPTGISWCCFKNCGTATTTTLPPSSKATTATLTTSTATLTTPTSSMTTTSTIKPSLPTTTTSLPILTTSTSASFGQYVITDNYSGASFFDSFNYYTASDPTHGLVQYVSKQTALAKKMTIFDSASGEVLINSNLPELSSTGSRESIRIQSMKTYNNGLFILDVTHIPSGPSLWPAFWLLGSGQGWPYAGEIDIVEGVNTGTENQSTLHTSPSCSMQGVPMSQTGQLVFADYDSVNPANGNRGCGVLSRNTNSFGSGFNSNKGGIYATEWTTSFIKVWFFPRNNIPSDIVSGSPNPSSWPAPSASFPLGTNCASSHFSNMQIVINTDFCGDWAGSVFPGGLAACNSYVKNNVNSFGDAFWSIKSLKVFSRN